ncbi:MAG: dTDP-4-dehydrorhamnose 3,5-epimerase family protein [Pirellulales bacterium]|nr:dTDP-4-dehydrorhamnose 3,5-epimerase family protein [Pirellulales bacterium]
MKFTSTNIAGALVIDLEPQIDQRGFFARAWCREEFARAGLAIDLAQTNIAWTERRGTLRGLHYQLPPREEAKLVRCTRGAAYVAVADIRMDASSRGSWLGVELTAENRRMLYVPPGCAQGYQTLVDGTELFYQMSTSHAPEFAAGIRHDDPSFNIRWPLAVTMISDSDRSWPLYSTPGAAESAVPQRAASSATATPTDRSQ